MSERQKKQHRKTGDQKSFGSGELKKIPTSKYNMTK